MKNYFEKLNLRIAWLCYGDLNTKFYHASTITRTRKNKILGLKENNNWIFNHQQIRDHILDHFITIYKTEHSYCSRSPHLYPVPHPTILNDHHNLLNSKPDLPEIQQALFSFQPLKAPGPDGLHPIFFQTYWYHTQRHLAQIIDDTFTTCHVDEELNKTFITLIPKKTKCIYYS